MSGTKHKAPQVRRFIEQRWLLDNVIAANGIDWDQPRTAYLGAPLGLEAQSDFAAIRLRVKKFADCSPAFQAQGRRREGRAKEALEAGNTVTARENYLMAAVHWGAVAVRRKQRREFALQYAQARVLFGLRKNRGA